MCGKDTALPSSEKEEGGGEGVQEEFDGLIDGFVVGDDDDDGDRHYLFYCQDPHLK